MYGILWLFSNRFIVKTKKYDKPEPSTSHKKRVDSEVESSSEATENSGTESEEISNPKPRNCKRKKISRYYCKQWELQYKWIKKDEETKRPICIACKQLLVNQKTHIIRHGSTKKHIENYKKAIESEKMQLTSFLPQNNSHSVNVAVAEIKLVLRMIINNQSYRSMDKLAKFNSSIYPDSSIAKLVCI